MNRAREPRVSISFAHAAADKHWGGIESICLLPTTATLFTASRDTFIKRWGLSGENGGGFRYQATLEGHSGWVTALSHMLVQHHCLLISASYDTTIKLWDPVSRGRPLHTFQEHSDYVLQLATAGVVQKFVSAGLRGDLHIWDLETCLKIASMNGSVGASDARPTVEGGGRAAAGSIYAMHCTPDLQLIAFTGADGSIWVYDPRSGREVGELKGHSDNVKAVRLSADGRRVVSASSDRTVRVWDVGQAACTAALQMHGDSVWSLAGDDSLSTVFSGGRDSRVFMTDVDKERTELVADAGAPVLDVQVDWDSRAVWVGTTLSNVTAWSFGDIEAPSEPVLAHPLERSSGASALARASVSRAHIPEYVPRASKPVVNLEGIAPLVRHAVFEDKRHILTLDANGVVALWDVVFCRYIRTYDNPKVDFEALYKELFLQMMDPVPAWFTSDVQLGVVTLHLTNPQAFSAELYAQAIGMNCPDDVKLNFGHEVLKSVLTVWKLKCEGRSLEDVPQSRSSEPFSLLRSRRTRPRVTSRFCDSNMPWSLEMHEFTGHEHEKGMLPKWVIDAVTKGAYLVPVSNAKLSFCLLPSAGSRLPKLERSRLTAPVILEVRKVVHYVKDRLREQGIDVDIAEITFNEAENQETWTAARTHLLQITCNGKLVPFNMTLNTVKRYLCTGRADEDIPLEYGLVDRGNAAPLPKIVPREISNH